MSFDFKKLTESPKLPTKLMLTIRLIIGCYLYYLVYDLRGSLLPPNTDTVMLIAAILFLVGGGIVIVFSLRDLITGRYIGGALDDSDTDNDSITDNNGIEDIQTEASDNDDINVIDSSAVVSDSDSDNSVSEENQ